MRSALNIEAMVAELDLSLSMIEMIRLLSAEAMEWSREKGLPLPPDFDKVCRLAIRARRGNPVPPPTHQPVLREAPGKEKPPKKTRERGKGTTQTAGTPHPIPMVEFLRQLRSDVLNNRLKGDEARLMPSLVVELKQVFGMNGTHRQFGGLRMTTAKGLTDVSEFILAGRAQPAQMQEAEELLGMRD